MAMPARKRLALIAHDRRKPDLLDWVAYNQGVLKEHELYATGTTGALVAERTGLPVTRFRSGPLGGDQQVGAGIAEGRIDLHAFREDVGLFPDPENRTFRLGLTRETIEFP